MTQNSIDQINSITEFLGIRLHNAQKQILQCDDKFIVIRASRRFGKSYVIAVYAIIEACTNCNYNIVIFSKSFRQSVEMMHTVYKLLINSPAINYIIKDTATTIELKNGSCIKCISHNDSNETRRTNIDLAIVDEAAYVDDNLITHLDANASSSNGRVILISTPNALITQFYEACRSDSKYTKFYFTHADAIFENGIHLVHEDEIDRAIKQSNTQHYYQEILAEFTDLLGNVRKLD